MLTYLLIAVGSALGGVSRYAMASAIDAQAGGRWPWGTLAVNVLGCLAIGALAGWGRDWVRSLAMIGFLGGFTTFSAFSLQALELARQGRWLAAGCYVAASVLLCLVAVACGWAATGARPPT